MFAKFTLGTKESTSQMFSKNGERMPVTFIKTRPCFVSGVRTPETHGYWGVQLAFGETKNISKPSEGILKKAGIKTPLRFLKEVRIRTSQNLHKVEPIEAVEEGKKKGVKIGESNFMVGDELPTNMFAEGDSIVVTGHSKGKGFQGVVRRHKFAGGPRTHGQSDRERSPGSIGQGTTPGRILKGKRMAGRMGGETITIENLTIVDTNEDGVFVKGLIPGVRGGLISIASTSPIVIVEEVMEEVEAPVEEVVAEEPVAEVKAASEEVAAEEALAQEEAPTEEEAPAEVSTEEVSIEEETKEEVPAEEPAK